MERHGINGGGLLGSGGEGYLDEAKSKYVSYYGCTPTFRDCHFFENNDGFFERCDLLYRDPTKELRVADGFFTLTPLTLRGVFGVGGSVKGFFKKAQAGVLFLSSNRWDQQLFGGGFFSYYPFPWWSVTTNVVKAWDEEIGQAPEDCRSALLSSIGTDISNKNHRVFGEYGKNWQTQREAYLFGAQGVLKGVSYGFTKEFCPDLYQFCYNGGDSLNVTGNFPLFNCFRGNISYLGTRNFIDGYKGGLYRENRVLTAMLTCPPRLVLTNFTYQYQVLEDRCSNFTTISNTGTLGASGFLCSLHYYVGAALGQYKNSYCCDSSPVWCEINSNISGCLNRCWYGSFNLSFGPFTETCFDTWKKRAGFRISWRGNSRFRFDAGINHWWFTRFDGVTCGSLRSAFFFCNGHTFEIDGLVKYIPSCCSYQYFTNFSYSIPWNVISGRKRSKSSLCGHLVDDRGDPLRYQQIQCGPRKTLTDKNGVFAFPNIDPGKHSLFVNSDTEGFVLANKEALSQNLEGGFEKNISLVMVRSSTLRGRVMLYGFEEVGQTVEEKALSTKGFKKNSTFKELKPIEGAAVYIYSKGRKETYTQLTNREGEFLFSQLPPGNWQVEVEWGQMPSNHEFVLDEDVVTLYPNETSDLRIKVVPKQRKIQTL